MSKNTGTSELINYFDLGVNGDVGISGSLTLDTIANAVIDTDKFLVSDNGIIKYRTGAELLSDIGVAGNYVTIDTAQTITGIKTFSGTNLQLESSGSADATILRNTSGVTGSTSNSNTIGFNGVNNIFVSTQNRGGFILGFNNSVQNREYTLPDASGTIALTSSIPANPVGGTGTTNYLPKFTGASTIGNSNLINDASGNLGLGVTPSAWSASFKALQVTNAAALWSATNGDLYLTNNVYNDGTNRFVYGSGSAYAAFYAQIDGQHIFYTASGGTAGNAISFTQAMTLTNGGDLFIGANSDSYVAANRRVVNITGTNEALISFRAGATAMGYIFAYASAIDISAIGRDFTVSTGVIAPTERLRITSGGNLLVGTTSDAGYKLDVNGTGRFSGNQLLLQGGSFPSVTAKATSTFPIFSLINDSQSAQWNIELGRTTSGNLEFYFSGTKVFFTPAGAATFSSSVTATNGTFSNTTDVRVKTIGTTNLSLYESANNSGSLYVGIDNSTGSGFGVGNYSRCIWSSGTGYPLVFATQDVERMRITSSGNVLIGTTTDVGAKLYVNGAIRTEPIGSGAITGNWKFGNEVSGTITENTSILVEIDGIEYRINARQV